MQKYGGGQLVATPFMHIFFSVLRLIFPGVSGTIAASELRKWAVWNCRVLTHQNATRLDIDRRDLPPLRRLLLRVHGRSMGSRVGVCK